MKRIAVGQVGLQQGVVQLFDEVDKGGPMWTGQGWREMRRTVLFDDSFVEPPAVMVNVLMWDVDHEANLRADLSAEDVGVAGFDLVFRTWLDTRMARLRVQWTAIGAAEDDPDAML